MTETRVLEVAARELVAFSLRSGSLHRAGFGATSAVEGIIGHKKVQRSRGDGYKAEVTVRHTHDYGPFALKISGRIDGLFEGEEPTVEEIKTTRRAFDDIAETSRALHLAQGKLYAFMIAAENDLAAVWVQVTYLNIETNKTKITRERFTRADLTQFFEALVTEYLAWATRLMTWVAERDAVLQSLEFPFPFRQGQRRFAAEVFRAITARRRLFAQAPTGIGKTLGALYPALKAMGTGRVTKLFYLTAKTVGAGLVANALGVLREHGLKLKSVNLTARDKICFEAPCDVEECPFAIGYYDRVRGALSALFDEDDWDRATIEQIGRAHEVCPYELAMDASVFADLVIGDVNYAFDPGARLQRFFEEKGRYVLLIDEAHNLVDRARAMFSAKLSKVETLRVKRAVKPVSSEIAKRLEAINRWFLSAAGELERGDERVERAVPVGLLPALQRLGATCEKHLAEGGEPLPDTLVEYYFEAHRFTRTAGYFDERFRAVSSKGRREVRIELLNLDPAHLLDAVLKRTEAAIFFSATLTPFSYYARLLAGNPETGLLELGSPFPPENLGLFVADWISTAYRHRDESIGDLVALIGTVTTAKAGNYLVYFPSYAYLEKVTAAFTETYPEVETLIQAREMDDAARADFLARFDKANDQTLIGFAVMGGAFGEGIDLIGDRLLGVIVVGVGLPQLCLERDLIKAHFAALGEDGFAVAYQIPGMSRVLQTAGRVIRTEHDRGIVCLVDRRFARPDYRALFPDHWQARFPEVTEVLDDEITAFWNGSG